MSNFIKKLFGTLTEKPWESERAKIDDAHIGKTFDLSIQTSAVIIIFGIATVLFSLVFTSYLYTLPPSQDTKYLLRPNLLWINTFVLFVISYYFSKVTTELNKKEFLIESLIDRIKSLDIDEVIIATSVTIEGQTTAYYLQDSLKSLDVKISKLAQGIPIGGELENLDDGTLVSAFKNRKNLNI